MPRKPKTDLDPRTNPGAAAAAAAADPGRNGGSIPLSSPTQQEAMARWVENFYSWVPAKLAQESAWAGRNPDDKDAAGRILYYRHVMAVARQLAWALRTFRLRAE